MEITDNLKGPADIVDGIRKDDELIGRIHQEILRDKRAIIPFGTKGLAVCQMGDEIVVGSYIPEEQVFEPLRKYGD
ncbi:MAG TPA: hypothetical protein VJJ21_00505 [Candidatus Nanoarchaeia archaeon]|nr:hypothetical protein [Candidatus Nanoarchaeia archaeon]